jgi:hypothetical protein
MVREWVKKTKRLAYYVCVCVCVHSQMCAQQNEEEINSVDNYSPHCCD